VGEDLVSILRLARKELIKLTPCVHGGEVEEVSEQRGKDIREILDFSANVNPLGPSPKALIAIRSNVWRVPFYPDQVSAKLKVAIAKHIGARTSNVIVGNGTTELIWLFTRVFIEKRDEALIPIPTYGEYETAVKGAGGKPKFVKLTKDFEIRAKNFKNKITSKTKIVFLCNPNNPTSKLILKEDLLEIVKEAERKNTLVFIDEDFMDFVSENKQSTFLPYLKAYRNVFIIRSFTKTYGLAGIRVGYGIGCEEMIELMHRAKGPWNVNCLAQVAALSALKDDQHLRRTRELLVKEKDYLSKNLSAMGLKVFPADANFFLIDVRTIGKTAAELKEELLKRYNILIRDCSSFTGLDEYYVRIAVRTREENKKLLNAMRAVLSVS
jgi:threonine-phosphate decarboxylase